MENSRKVRRVCKNCGLNFELSQSQLRQTKSKWPVNCSRSCARSAQHKKNYKYTRAEKKCEVCSKIFIVVNWNKDKKFCSSNCSATARFGEKDNSVTLERLNRILTDDKYLKHITVTAKRIALKFKKGDEFAEDIVQEFFLSLSEGNNTTIENVANSMIRKEMKKGITGKWKCDFSFSTEIALSFIKTKKKELNSIEFREYIIDLFSGLSEFERSFLTLYIKGFKDREVMDLIRKEFPIGNEKFYSEKRRLFKEIDYSSFGQNYDKPKVYS